MGTDSAGSVQTDVTRTTDGSIGKWKYGTCIMPIRRQTLTSAYQAQQKCAEEVNPSYLTEERS